MQRALRELNVLDIPSPSDLRALDALDAELADTRTGAKRMEENAPRFKRLVKKADIKGESTP